MERRKIILTQRQIELLAENELAKMRMETPSEETPETPETEIPAETGEDDPTTKGLSGMMGDPADRKIEYPSAGDIEAVKTGIDNDEEGGAINPMDMKSPPHELLTYLDKLEEAKSILSKVAAKEDDENIKNRIYAHYEKAQKLAFELIKEFGIVH